MASLLRRRWAAFHAWLSTGPNRIALATALRGSAATAIPLLVLPALGFGGDAGIVVIGALSTAMVDIGGFYYDRLLGMAVVALLNPLFLLIGAAAAPSWLIVAPTMFVVSALAGLARALGPMGVPIGPAAVTAFLIGFEVSPDVPHHFAGRVAVDYLAGGCWTILVTLANWTLRPYKRLEFELAGAWVAVAELFAAARAEANSESVVGRRRHEQQLAASHRVASAAIGRAATTLGQIREGTTSPGVVMGQLLVLQRTAARLAASALTLAESRANPAEPLAQPKHLAAIELERACRQIADSLVRARGTADIAAFRAQVAALLDSGGLTVGDQADVRTYVRSGRYLEDAAEALRLLFAHRHGPVALLRHVFANRTSLAGLAERVRAQLNWGSIIFRYALRVAVITATATALQIGLQLTHGIWLPMTTQVILQPEYGSTLARALQRTSGTLAGAVVAAVLLAGLRNTLAFEIAMIAMLFATLFLLRRSYGWAITFLTPLVILLLRLSGPDPWADLGDRVGYTIVGAALAIMGGSVLWPDWERDRLPSRLAQAVSAGEKLATAVLRALAEPGAERAGQVASLRSQAELALANAEAAFHNMVAEPATFRSKLGPDFQSLVNIHRLCRHAVALSAIEELAPAARPDLVRLAELLGPALAAVAASIEGGGPAPPRPDFDPVLAQIAADLGMHSAPDTALLLLLGRLVGDCSGLLNAARQR